jgi:hypothetical protein
VLSRATKFRCQARRTTPSSSVARIDQIALADIVEALVAAYLETRLHAIHQAETDPRGVIDLSAWREERGAATARGRRSSKMTRRRSASQR